MSSHFSIPQSSPLGMAVFGALVPVWPLSHLTNELQRSWKGRRGGVTMQVQRGGPEKSSVDYLPPKKCNQNHQQSIGSETRRRKERNQCWGGWSGRSQAAQSVSCEGCEEQIRGPQRRAAWGEGQREGEQQISPQKPERIRLASQGPREFVYQRLCRLAEPEAPLP